MSRSRPSDAVGHAARLLNAGDIPAADAICREAVARNRRDVAALAILGQIATMQGRYDDAAAALSRCITLAPRQVDFHVLLAEVRMTQAKHREALARYEKALKLKPDYGPAVAGKANVLIRQGRWDRARLLLAPFVKRGTEDAGMAIVYCRIERHDGRPEDAAAIARRHLDDPGRAEITRTLWFEIGKCHEQTGQCDEAFEAFTQGNRVAPGRWDPATESDRYDRTMALFTRERLATLPRPPDPSDVPVFIVGMLRSGSTLVEQIIDAHPDAFGAGEVLHLPLLVRELNLRIGSTLPYPQCVADLDASDVESLAAAYLDQLRREAPQAQRICDKYLPNYEHLGLIRVLFPKARIIHTRRDPIDTCLSCYVQKFAPGVPAYTEDLRHLGLLYNDYRAIMAHWRDVLGEAMLEIDYETLVTEPHATSRRIIEFCGLEWDDACLRFWETKREVLTLSRDQVSQPMYTTAIGRHGKYAKHLGPLIEVLQSGDRGSGARIPAPA